MKKTAAIIVLAAIITTSSYSIFANEGILSSREASGDVPRALITVEENVEGDVEAHIVLTNHEVSEITKEVEAIVLAALEELETALSEADAILSEIEVTKEEDIDKEIKELEKLKENDIIKKITKLESLVTKMNQVLSKVPVPAQASIEKKIHETQLKIIYLKAQANLKEDINVNETLAKVELKLIEVKGKLDSTLTADERSILLEELKNLELQYRQLTKILEMITAVDLDKNWYKEQKKQLQKEFKELKADIKIEIKKNREVLKKEMKELKSDKSFLTETSIENTKSSKNAKEIKSEENRKNIAPGQVKKKNN